MLYPRIRALREDHDLSQDDLAKELGVSQSAYSKYETGAIEPPSGVLVHLALFYNTSVDYLVGITDRSAAPPPSLHQKQILELYSRHLAELLYGKKDLSN